MLAGQGAWRQLADDHAALGDPLGQRGVLFRIDHVGAGSEDRRGRAAAERAAVRRGIDTARQSADDNHTGFGETRAELMGDFETVGRRGARADDGHGRQR